MSFHVYNQISAAQDHVYKLVQLPPALLDVMKTGNQKIQFKAPGATKNHLVVCTDNDTYTVRQMNHSNTVLLVNDMSANPLDASLTHRSLAPAGRVLLGVALSSYEYELTPTDGYIDTSGIATYTGSGPVPSKKTVSDVIADLPIALLQFADQWHLACGSEVDGLAVLLSPAFVTDVLYTVISHLVATRADTFDPVDVASQVQKDDSRVTAPVVATIAGKFCVRTAEGQLQLDEEAVARWFGLEVLKRTPSAVSDNELLLQWKSSLPPFYSAPLEMRLLHGHYCRPEVGKVRYLARAALSPEIHARIKEMFQMVREWDYDEFLPFVAEFIPATKKADSVLLKYSRKRRVGKRFVVGPR